MCIRDRTLLKDHRADAQIEDQIVMALYLEGKPDMKQYVKQIAFYEPCLLYTSTQHQFG